MMTSFTEGSLRVAEAAQQRGLPIYVETRPIYLQLTRERFEGDTPGAVHRPAAAMTRRRGMDRSQPSREWIGGRFSTPFYIQDPKEPYRPDIVLWMELPEGFVVGQAVVNPEDREGAVARALRNALTQPAIGSPRRPSAIRVPDAATAAEVRAEVGAAIPVTVAPTPELDALLEKMIETLPPDEDDEPSYFAQGHVSVAAVKMLFAASRRLFAAKPWTVVDDTQVIRMDIPALDVEGACLSVIGQLDESRGVLVFPSVDDFEAFLDVAESGDLERGRMALSAGWLGLLFEPATELPPSMRREAMEHGWAGGERRRLPCGGPPRPRRPAAAAGRTGCRDRHRVRAVPQRVLREAPSGLRVGSHRAGLRVVPRR